MSRAFEQITDAAEQDLDTLARLHGILPDYQDVWGERRQVTGNIKRAVLDAMGVACHDADAVAASLAREQAGHRRRMLDPVQVITAGVEPAVAVRVPDDLAGGTLAWRVTEEHGAVHEGEWIPDGGDQGGQPGTRLVLPPTLPVGYHQVHVAIAGRRASMSLIVAPAECYLPESLVSGGRWWGLAAQLYGVRRRHDWGMGDFSALAPLLTLCARHGAAMLGLSPLHAMFPTWPEHSSPYSPSSRLFLNVLYIDLERAADVTASPTARERMTSDETSSRLTALREAELVDYRGVAELKLPVLELAFADFAAEPAALRYRQFQQFCDSEGDTLLRHAVFEALQEHFHGLDPEAGGWPQWPQPYQDPASSAVASFARTHAHRVDFHRWLQWLADEQLGAAARHADDRDLGIGLYMDLAVSVDKCGAETWCNRHVYALGASVGAPPDLVSVKGQNWGLPPLDPRALFESGYALFIETLRRNMRHAGALRIDHVMGLMRLFWIPEGVEPGDGAYVSYPIDDLLGIVALESQRNRCVVIGEDLGTVPEGLFERMQRLRILSYRLLYFEHDEDGRFRGPDEYTAQSLVAVSTHDLPTLRGWWTDRDLEWRARLELYPDDDIRRDTEATRERERQALRRALADNDLDAGDEERVPVVDVHRFLARTTSMLLLVQIEDALGVAEQANLPATLDEHPNWRRRLPVTVEALSEHQGFRAVATAAAEERRVQLAPATAAPAVPTATYRLQLHAGFTFDQARELVDYLHELGISHAYASPYLQSRAGSTHGYDITDHNAIDADIGSRQAHADWVATLHNHGMGHVLDIVPNHMGVMGDDNGWWLDVLEHGEAARYASFFDIDWHPSERALTGKVLLPVLGAAYGQTLDQGELLLAYDSADGRFVVRYYEHLFPVDPREYPMILNGEEALRSAEAGLEPLTESVSQELASISAAFARLPRRSETARSAVEERYRDSELLRQRLLKLYREVQAVAGHVEACVAAFNEGRALHDVLERQAWRLAHWRTASDEINYRRFFDINDLAGLRTEDPDVFEAVHKRVLSLVERGAVSGLRVDHPDGLYDPAGYFRRLRERCAELRPTGAPAIFLLVEKILAVDEPLPEDWDVSGTTGYDFGATVNGVFVDPAGEEPLSRCYADLTGSETDVEDMAYHCKHLVMGRLLAGELQVLGNRLHRIGQSDPRTRDYTRNSLVQALRDLVACFPVYRTYVRGPVVSRQDQRNMDKALGRARRRNSSVAPEVFDFLADVLAQRDGGSPGRRQAMQDFTMKLQQFTAPVTAKGVEDTLFYRYARLLSLNDVGDEPGRFGVTVEDFHGRNTARRAHWPDSMLATSSHDSKRGEDMRARLNVLSEVPELWRDALVRWRRANESLVQTVDDEPAPSANDQYFLYQTLVGSWPLSAMGATERDQYRQRIRDYMIKVMREAKLRSSWISPNEAYENAVLEFVDGVLDPARSAAFIDDLRAFVDRLVPPGLLNSLAQTVLKLTSPGVPDIYQGSELWNFDLVDPDNRRPVDYGRRRSLLARLGGVEEIPDPQSLLNDIVSGLPKLHVVRQVLALRARLPGLFALGDYVPLPASGAHARHVCAFARRGREGCVVVVVPRLTVPLWQGPQRPPLGDCWQNTEIELPASLEPRGIWFGNVLTGERHRARNRMPLSNLLATFPVAVLAEGAETTRGGGGY